MLRFLTAGESHGPQLTAILEGFPAGIKLAKEDINHELKRRQKSLGSGGRMKIEKDQVTFSAGVINDQSTGAPIALHIENLDWKNWADKTIDPMTIPRPGHSDLTGALKYGYQDLRLALERGSARETAARVAVGALCKIFLTTFDIKISSYVASIGKITANLDSQPDYSQRFAQAEQNDLRCPDQDAYKLMQEEISNCTKAQDTLGGVVELVALDVPPGLGSHVHFDRRLDGKLMGLIGSIPAIKGVECGPAFENSTLYGSQVHDELVLSDDNQSLKRKTNRAGGFEGGITTGEPLVLRMAMKPISTVMKSLKSVDLSSQKETSTVYERSDFCAVPRAGVVGEAMLSFGIAQALLEKVGGDHIDEIKSRVLQLRQNRLDDLKMNNAPWKLRY